MVVGVGEGKDSGRFGSAVGVVEAPALGARAFNAFARTILLDESIIDPAFNQRTEGKATPSQAQGVSYTQSTECQSHHQRSYTDPQGTQVNEI